MKPALATLVLWAGVPGEPEHLEAPVRKRDEVLLERVDTECIGDFVIVERPVGTVGTDHKLVTDARKCADHAEIFDRNAGKSPSTVSGVAFSIANA